MQLQDIEIPTFLRRQRGVINVITEEDSGRPHEEVATDMRMVTLFLNEGGARGYLRIAEGNQFVHLLHVPTLEYLRMSIEDVGRCQVGDDRPVNPNLADRIYDKVVMFEMHKLRYSRALVSQALVKLGREPLVDNTIKVEGLAEPTPPTGAQERRGKDGALEDAIVNAVGKESTRKEAQGRLEASGYDKAMLDNSLGGRLDRLARGARLLKAKDGKRVVYRRIVK